MHLNNAPPSHQNSAAAHHYSAAALCKSVPDGNKSGCEARIISVSIRRIRYDVYEICCQVFLRNRHQEQTC